MEKGLNESKCLVPIRILNMGSPLYVPKYFRFKPKDDELISEFFLPKCCKLPLIVDVIAELDIYKFNPWELPEKSIYGENEWYFFTSKARKYPRSNRHNRSAGLGYWKITGKDKKIGHPKVIGFKKSMVFYVKNRHHTVKTNWIMQEYRLSNVDHTTKVVPSNIDELDLVCVYNKEGLDEQYSEIAKIDLKEADTDAIFNPAKMTISSTPELLGIDKNVDNISYDTFIDDLMLSFPSVPDNIDEICSSVLTSDYTSMYKNNPFKLS